MLLKKKLIPAAFPALTTTSRLALTEVCAGAIKVSWATGLPSAVIITQVVFSARMTTLNGTTGLALATEAAAGAAFLGALLAEPVVDGAVAGRGETSGLEAGEAGLEGSEALVVLGAGALLSAVGADASTWLAAGIASTFGAAGGVFSNGIPGDDFSADDPPSAKPCPVWGVLAEAGG